MRDEQYYALANLVKRPMRRWWVRVGSWWMLGLGILLVGLEWLQGSYIRQHTGRHGYFTNQPDWYSMVNDPCELTRGVCIGIAIFCALSVITIIDRTTHQSLAFSVSGLKKMKYKVALLNSWPALIPFFLGEIVYGYPFKLYKSNNEIPILGLLAESLDSLLYNSIWVVWLVAIAVVTSGIRWQVWVLFLGGVSPSGFMYIYNYYAPSLPVAWGNHLFSTSMNIEMSSHDKFVFGWVGLLLVYGLYKLYLDGKTALANWMCIVFSVVLLQGALGAGFHVFVVDYILTAASYLTTEFQPLGAYYYTGFAPKLILAIGGYSFSFLAEPVWAIVPVLIGILWVYVHYLALSWLMGRDWRRRGK